MKMKSAGNKDELIDDPRRVFLLRALAAGLFAGGTGWNLPAMASWFGGVPSKLPEGRSIFEMKGEVMVNGAPATHDTLIKATDTIRTGSGSYVITAVGDSAFIVREKSVLELGGKALLVSALRLLSGKMLGVFGHRNTNEGYSINTQVATIGIRGTGVYAESDPEKTYLCTCYGSTDIASNADPKDRVQLTTMHHDAPKYILAEPDSGKRIIPAPFKNHTDLELMTIEAIVGRKVPFGVSGQEYERPRREY